MSTIIAVNKAKRSCSGNKMLHCKWAKEGDKFFVTKEKGEYIFSPTEKKETAKEVTVRLNTYPVYCYINVIGILEKDGYYTVIKEGDDFHIRIATDSEIEKYARKYIGSYNTSGYIPKSSRCSCINIINEDSVKLFSTGFLKMTVVNDGRLFLEATPITSEEALTLPTLVEAAKPFGGIAQLDKAETYTYYIKKTPRSRELQIPISFIRKSGVKCGEPFRTWFREDGTFIVAANPVTCDICGNPIDCYSERAKEVYVCKSCHRSIPVMRNVVYKGQSRNFKQVKEELSEIRSMLMTIKDAMVTE